MSLACLPPLRHSEHAGDMLKSIETSLKFLGAGWRLGTLCCGTSLVGQPARSTSRLCLHGAARLGSCLPCNWAGAD